MPGVIVLPPKLVTIIPIHNFCNKGESWIDEARTRIAAEEPNQLPNLKIFSNNPNPMTIKINKRIKTKTYPLNMLIPSVSFLNCPARPYPIITPTSDMRREMPNNLLFESIG